MTLPLGPVSGPNMQIPVYKLILPCQNSIGSMSATGRGLPVVTASHMTTGKDNRGYQRTEASLPGGAGDLSFPVREGNSPWSRANIRGAGNRTRRNLEKEKETTTTI